MRVVLPLALVLVAGCGGQHTTTLRISSPAPELTGRASAVPVLTARPTPVLASTGQATAGTGHATLAGTTVASTAGTRTAPASSPPATIAATAGTVVVTDDASGSTVRLHLGQRLQVRLSQGTYDPPLSSAEAILTRRSSTGGYPSTEPVDALFEAIARGNADVTASSDAACFHTQPRCMMATREWVVHVTVMS